MSEPFENQNEQPTWSEPKNEQPVWEQSPNYYYKPPKKEKSGWPAGLVIAVTLVCSLLAGAFGAGVVAFLGGALKSGIETVLDCVGFDELLRQTDLVFTGEGQLDSQSLRGKVVIGIARRAAAQKVPVIAVVGSIGEGAEGAYDLGVTSVLSINRRAEDFSVSRHKTKENFSATMDSIVRLLAR